MKNIYKTLLILQAMFLALSMPVFANDDVLFLTITNKERCSTCKKLEPVLEELESAYSGQIEFLTLDTSTKDTLEEAKQKAEEYSISAFFNENKNMVPKVAILCPGGKPEKIFVGETRKETYEEAINEILLDSEKLCSL